MSSEKAQALVLKLVDFSETSRVVTLFTREHGRVRALAKGARRLKGPFEAALDLLTLCRVVFLRKTSEALSLLTEAKVVERFRGSPGHLASIYAGYYVAELLGELTDDFDPHPALFDEAAATLRRLATLNGTSRAAGPTTGPLPLVIARFELAALAETGHLPALNVCVGCDRRLESLDGVQFGLGGGGLICPRCRGARGPAATVTPGTLRLMQRLARESPTGTEEDLRADAKTLGELRGLLTAYVSRILGKRPRMASYLAPTGK